MYRHRQLHLWVTDHDYSLLRDLAAERKETLSSVIRRLIKLQRPEPSFAGSATDAEPCWPPSVS
jgi:hypothetical protein